MLGENALFAPTRVNRGRQAELDIAKGLSILFMLLVHCFEEFTAWPLQPSVSTYIIEFLGSPPSAPVFMFALGVGIVYARKGNAKALMLRGVRLLILGYVLSFFRDFLPHYLLYVKTGQASYFTDAVNLFLGVDILQFAGLAFLFFGVAARLRFKPAHYALAAVVCAGANLLLSGVIPENPALSVLLGLFWGTNEYAWFPFLTWILYPIFGCLFGQFLVRCLDKGRWYRAVLGASFPILALFLIYSFLMGVDFGASDGFYQEAYYHHDMMGNIVMISFVVCWMSLIYLFSSHIPAVVGQTLSRWSKNITVIYCVHWLIIGWSLTIMDLPISLPWILLYFVALVVVSDLFSVYYLKLKSQMIERMQAGKKADKAISA
jgi:uncharacterized membrane protein